MRKAIKALDNLSETIGVHIPDDDERAAEECPVCHDLGYYNGGENNQDHYPCTNQGCQAREEES